MVKEVKREIHDCIKDNDNGQVDPTILWDTIKAIMRGKLISRTAYLNCEKRANYETLQEKIRGLEKQHQKHKDKGLLGQLGELREQMDNNLKDELEKKLRFAKQTFYESGPKATKFLAKRLRSQQNKHAIHSIKNPQSNRLTQDPDEIQETFTKYYESLYSKPESVEDERIKQYL